MTSWARAATLFQAMNPEFVAWTGDQEAAHDLWLTREDKRMLLFYPTGKGKTKTCLGLIAEEGFKEVYIIAPPKTHHDYRRDSIALNVVPHVMSVEKFRQKDTKLRRGIPIIVDEFHLLGKHNSVGFKKFDRMAPSFPAIILASATPNYNDADRAYCIAHSLDPLGHQGGYIKWVYQYCETRVNPFATAPYVDGFLAYDSAADFLVDQGYTAYVEDDAVWTEEQFLLPSHRDSWFETYGYDRYAHRMIASDMEKRHRRTFLARVDPRTGLLWGDVLTALENALSRRGKPWLIFCQHSTIAEAVKRSLDAKGWLVGLITGTTTPKMVGAIKKWFTHDEALGRILVGTSTLATGVDGLDRVCDQLLIFDDIEGDHSKRRQLIGRVLPRGTTDRATRVVFARTTE